MDDLKLKEKELKREARALETALDKAEKELGAARRTNERLHLDKINSALEVQRLNDRINEQTAFYNSITDQLQALKAKKLEADIEKDGWRSRAQEISEELSTCKGKRRR